MGVSFLSLLLDAPLAVLDIEISILILAGEKSDFLPLSLAVEMQTQNPRARIVRIPGVGHTPMLMQSDQIDPVVQFLLEV